MNYKKLILVGVISGFVTLLTYFLGISGTLIGSVLFSVLYNMLSEALEDPFSNAKFSQDFEWDIVYVVPLVVIALIQLLLIFALLAERGILPYFFANAFLSIQDLANNNLYRLLGIALLFISVYPIVLKPNVVKKEHGIILAFVGVIFLARGFVDLGNVVTDIYDDIFMYFDLPIAIMAFLLISFVVWRILSLSSKSQKEFKQNQHENVDSVYVSHNHPHERHYGANEKFQNSRRVKHNPGAINHDHERHKKAINESSNNIHFESNDLLDEYRK